MESCSLKNKSLILIGGTSGMGLAAAQAFVAQGAKIVAVGLDEQSCAQARKELGTQARILVGDAVNPQTAVRAIQESVQFNGGFHGLFHVAGGSGRRFGDGPLHELSLEGWHKTFEINLTSMMLSNQAAVRYFLEKKQGGSILNMGSVLGFSPSSPYFSTYAYTAAKSAIIGFSKAIAAHYAADNIRVNVLAPGVFATPMAQRAINDESISAFIKTKQPLGGGRPGRPEEIAAAACYFMSDGSAFTTGQLLSIDGGWQLSEGQYL